jgi:hypothetical protein
MQTSRRVLVLCFASAAGCFDPHEGSFGQADGSESATEAAGSDAETMLDPTDDAADSTGGTTAAEAGATESSATEGSDSLSTAASDSTSTAASDSTSMDASDSTSTDASTSIVDDDGTEAGSDGASSSEGASDSTTAEAGPGDLVLNFSGYLPVAGSDIHVALFAEDDTELALDDAVVMDDFSVTIPDIILEGQNYNVRWWVDANGNGVCDTPPTDRGWELSGEAGTADGLVIDHAYDSEWTDVCPFWE